MTEQARWQVTFRSVLLVLLYIPILCCKIITEGKDTLLGSKIRSADRNWVYLLATASTCPNFSLLTRKTMFRCEASMLSFSRKKTRSTPYSWRVENFTKMLMGPASSFSMTRFFLPRTCSIVSSSLCERSDEETDRQLRAAARALCGPSRRCRWC